MTIQSIVENELIEDPSSVWLLKGHTSFAYSDGASTEKYLDKVMRSAKDLGSRSSELATHIKDWTSEYHLTVKRGQLLSGFDFDRSLKVLEVGCGCGAITRVLGEMFDSVVSVEGSIHRARLARLRARDLPSVNVVCAPFQEIRFKQKFDVIFCIGVFEYSASFVDGKDPYEAVLAYFADLLTPDGMVVIAIENQFGLKYFNGYREDHVGRRFEGIEGYHRRRMTVRTFSKGELEHRLARHFKDIRFFYPYPDYKIPDCVLSSEFLASPRSGELVSQLPSRDYAGPVEPLWDEAAVTLELARADMLGFFANSFLVVAGRSQLKGIAFDQLAVLYSEGRRSELSTSTRIKRAGDGSWRVSKRSGHPQGAVDAGKIKLVDTDGPWIDGPSLSTEIALRARSKDLDLEQIFAPARHWVDYLSAESKMSNGVRVVGGAHIDSIWTNAYAEGDGIHLIDREWIWQSEIPLNALVIRAIYNFMLRLESVPRVSPALAGRSGRALISRIAETIGVRLVAADFDRFIALETELQELVCGANKSTQAAFTRWFLADRPSLRRARRSLRQAQSLSARIRARLP